MRLIFLLQHIQHQYLQMSHKDIKELKKRLLNDMKINFITTRIKC